MLLYASIITYSIVVKSRKVCFIMLIPYSLVHHREGIEICVVNIILGVLNIEPIRLKLDKVKRNLL